MSRSTARDGFLNQVQFHALTNYEPVWEFLSRRPVTRRFTNRALINSAVQYVPTRPNPFSTLTPYTSWASLTDRTYDSRHLPPAPERAGLPPAETVAGLFSRTGEGTLCAKSTVLFPYFAEWFVDGFLRSERPHPDPKTGKPTRDPARNESNHEIDLIQIYGLNEVVTGQLRAHEGGLLLSQTLEGE